MAQQETRRNLPDRVAGWYYSHGLFCSSHPVAVIGIAITIVLLCCYPLLNLPLPGNTPQTLWSAGNSSYPGQWNTSSSQDSQLPRWFTGTPTVYVQQIVIRTTVTPWTQDLVLTDAFRAPLAQVFQLLEIIRNFQHENSSKTLSKLCLHVEAVKIKADKRPHVLPEYNCLILSPAGLWQNNRDKFQEDANLLTTIFGYQNLQKGKISLTEMLFGMNMKETGIKRYPLRTRQRVLQYAVTVVLVDYDIEFIESLHQRLRLLYPLHQLPSNESTDVSPVFLHIYYPGQFHYREFMPLAITYFSLFLYVYFSVRKIELVKSKIGMAFSAMATVLASLSMSIGLCFFFGLTLSLNGKEIYPYLVVIVGLENVLVLTKSVVSTPMHLDVKIRVAQGLSREGWSITKNLLTEVTILTIGLFTFVPAIQEFCIFAVVGLLSDFFLQMLFFSTVLSIDIRRMEIISELVRITSGSSETPRRFRQPYSQTRNIVRSKSHPKLTGAALAYPTNVVASSTSAAVKVPKRLRLVHFWARTRIFQRMFMISMVVWISVIAYSSFPVEQLFPQEASSPHIGHMLGDFETLDDDRLHKMTSAQQAEFINDLDEMKKRHAMDEERKLAATSASILSSKLDHISPSEDLNFLKHVRWQPSLSKYHWPTLLSAYNISLSGRYISILPAIRLSHAVRPELAIATRNYRERQQHFQWQSLAAALDPLDFSESGDSLKPSTTSHHSEAPYVPSSPMELFLTAVLCVVSVLVVAYTMVVLYGCVCTRNYAEWRSSWRDKESTQEGAAQVVLEAVPLVMEGHLQDVECLTSDGALLVSSDLSGQIRVWDSLTGESIALIDRRATFASQRKSASDLEQEELPLSDYESGSPPSSSEAIPSRVQGEDPVFNLERSYIRSRYPDHPAVFDDITEGHIVKTFNPVNENPTRRNFHRNFDQENCVPTTNDGSVISKPPIHDETFWNLPDLKPLINTNFSSHRGEQKAVDGVRVARSGESDHKNCDAGTADIKKCGFDFGENYRRIYSDHYKLLELESEDNQWEVAKRPQSRRKQLLSESNKLDVENQLNRDTRFYVGSAPAQVGLRNNSRRNLKSRLSESGDISCDIDTDVRTTVCNGGVNTHETQVPHRLTSTFGSVPTEWRAGAASSDANATIWCIDCNENLLAIGCSDGRLEFWEGSTGTFKCVFEDGSGNGVTAIRLIGNRVVAAKLSGCLDFFELESYSHGRPMDWGFTSHRRTHVRTGSAGSALNWDSMVSRHDGSSEDIRCIRLNTSKAHQQPITVLDSEGGRVLTGSQDHTLKVYRLEDQLPLYTLHGHCGPITCLFIDRISPMMSGSGSQDGLLCVWDLLTGACMYSIAAHNGSVSALTYSASYVISLGTDERLCVWERFQGHLLNTIQVTQAYCTSMVMLTHNLLITSKQGSLVVWDVRSGDAVRMVTLGHTDSCVFVKQLLLLGDSIACDYGNQLRLVRFPLATDKRE